MFGLISFTFNNNQEKITSSFERMNDTSHQFDGKSKELILYKHQGIFHIENKSFFTENENYILTYTGKIFGIKLLVTSEQSHYSAQELLKIYIKRGKDFVKDISGEFAILIIDKKNKSLQSFRDSIGLVPFYYAIHNDIFYFSTEFRRLAILDFLQKVDWQYITLLLSYIRPQTHKRTYLKTVKRLQGGYLLTYKYKHNIKIEFLYKLQPTLLNDIKNDADVIEIFQSKLEQSVIRQVKSKNKISCHFSGGLDSTGIAAIAENYCLKYNKSVTHYICGLTSNQLKNKYKLIDERQFIKRIVGNSQLSLPKIMGNKEDITHKNLYKNFLFPHFHYHQVYIGSTCLDMTQNKSKILLSGFGGDQCVTSNQRPDFLFSALKNLKFNSFWKDSRAYGWRSTLLALSYPFPFLDNWIKLFRPNTKIFRKKNFQVQPIIKETQRIQPKKRMPNSLREDLVQMLYLPETVYRIESEWEFASYYGIQIRYPLLDKNLLEFFLGLKERYLRYQGKGRHLYRTAISKWIDYDEFINQPKSVVAPAPGLVLAQKQAVANNHLNYEKIIEQIPKKLLKYIHLPNRPQDEKDRKELIRLEQYVKIAEISYFINKWDK